MQEEFKAVQQIYELGINFLVNYSFQITGAIIIFIAGIIAANWIARLLLRVLEKRQIDVTLRQFIASAVRLVIIALFVMIALSKLGISITPLLAALGGLAIGASFAIQGPISNYGAGLVIILTRMFKVGDTIAVKGCYGVVTHIDLSTTHLKAEDGEDIIIPNRHIVGEIHRNSYNNRLLEGKLYLDVHADPAAAAEIVYAAIASIAPRDTPPAVVGIEAFAPGSIVLGYRYWVPTEKYFEQSFAVNNRIHGELEKRGIALAHLPQLSGLN